MARAIAATAIRFPVPMIVSPDAYFEVDIVC
jgi:hypothetical protein